MKQTTSATITIVLLGVALALAVTAFLIGLHRGGAVDYFHLFWILLLVAALIAVSRRRSDSDRR